MLNSTAPFDGSGESAETVPHLTPNSQSSEILIQQDYPSFTVKTLLAEFNTSKEEMEVIPEETPKDVNTEITKKLTPLRRQLKICERIENKVPRLRALIEQEKQLEQGRYKYKYYKQTKSKQRSYER